MSEIEKHNIISIEYIDIINELGSYQILLEAAMALMTNELVESSTYRQKCSKAHTLMSLYLDKIEEMKSKANELYLKTKNIT